MGTPGRGKGEQEGVGEWGWGSCMLTYKGQRVDSQQS